MFGTTKELKKENGSEYIGSETLIGKGSIFDGNIETVGPVRVDGRIEGNISSRSKVVFGEGAVLEGSLTAHNAEISGTVKGLVEISELLVLKASAIIDGDIICNKLIVESGAVFKGTCKMGNQPHDDKAKPNTFNPVKAQLNEIKPYNDGQLNGQITLNSKAEERI